MSDELRSLGVRTEALEPSPALLARLHAIPTGTSFGRRGSSGAARPLFATIANYAIPSFALAAAAAILFAVASPNADTSFDDDLATLVTAELSP